MKKIFLMGPQGSGKGTQAKRLGKQFGIPALSMGQLIRDEVATGSEHGKKLESIINAGELVSDENAAELLKRRLALPDVQNGYLLDGYPRNEAQMSVFDFDMPTHVVVLEIPREESLKRLGGRLTCDACSSVYAVKDGFVVGDTCDCGGKLMQRDDDTPEAIGKRLDIYERETKPIIARYEESGLVRHIEGIGSENEVFDRILRAVQD